MFLTDIDDELASRAPPDAVESSDHEHESEGADSGLSDADYVDVSEQVERADEAAKKRATEGDQSNNSGGLLGSAQRAPLNATGAGTDNGIRAATNTGGDTVGEQPGANPGAGAATDEPDGIEAPIRQTTVKLQTLAVNKGKKADKAPNGGTESARPKYKRQLAVDESAAVDDSSDAASKLIWSDNVPSQLIREPVRASGRRCNGNSGTTPNAKRARKNALP